MNLICPMDIDKFKSVLTIGETSSVEFKRCEGEVEYDVFESICAFLNRFGGDVYLGVLNDGTVKGVNAANAAAMMKNIINVVGNPNVFKPSPYIEVDSFVWEGKTVIRIHAPVSADVHSYKGDVYDRMGEVDVKIRATAQIADLYMRKRGIYTEREIFPNLTLDDFRLDLLPMVRQEAQNHLTNGKRHPWKEMDDEELFRASGLIDEDKVTKEVGFNLASVLLLGKDETIVQICPQYETDALLRVVNVDRYDDRHVARTNLLESYDELLDFSRKHLPAPFFLEDDKRLNLREIIVREMIANVLIHREFTSLDKSMFVIERERMYTSNPCNPMRDGRITPENVHPKAKNPVIAGFFREIGRADRLGSGIRNLYKYCKDYGGSDPVFTEGNEFVISVPLKKLDPIRFPFEKPSIAPKKPSIQCVLDRLNLVRPTYENIVSLYEKLDDGEIFGRKRIMELIELSNGSAGDLLKIMLKNKLLDTIKGCGKGKYRFVSFSASVDSNSPALAKKITGAVVPVTEPVTAPVNEPLCSAEFLLSIIRKNPGKRKRELVSLTGLRPWNVKRLLEGPLKNRIEFRGACRTGGYYVIDNLGNPV